MNDFKAGFWLAAGATAFAALVFLAGKLLTKTKTEASGCGCGGK
jgi:hypothetical protein